MNSNDIFYPFYFLGKHPFPSEIRMTLMRNSIRAGAA